MVLLECLLLFACAAVVSVLYDLQRIWRYARRIEEKMRSCEGKANSSPYLGVGGGRIMDSREHFERKLETKKNSFSNLREGLLEGASPLVLDIVSESIVLAGGASAVLEQLSHPYVAYAINAHSYLMTKDGIRQRFYRTFHYMFSIQFGDWETVRKSLLDVRRLHEKIKGTIPEDLEGGVYKKGHSFDALSESAAYWVFATLIFNHILAYETLVRNLTDAEKEEYYAFVRTSAEVWGLNVEETPKTWAEFEEYVFCMFYSPVLAPSSPAVEYTKVLMLPFPFDPPGVNSSKLAAVMMTPLPILKFVRLHRTTAQYYGALVMGSVISSVYRCLPYRFRQLTKYRERVHRVTDQKGLDWVERLAQRIGIFIVDATLGTK